MIPAAAITTPSRRSLEMLAGPRGLFDQDHEPFALRRAPFRIDATTLIPPGVDEALAVLASLAPAGTNWLASQLLDLGEGRGVWRVLGRYTVATTSRRLADPPLFDRTTEVWYATYGLPRLPDGLHSIVSGGRRLLEPRP